MTRREKTIVTVTACGAFAAAVYYVVLWLGGDTAAGTTTQNSHLTSLLPVAQTQLIQSELPDSDRRILESIRGPWGDDPFSKEAVLLTTVVEPDAEEEEPYEIAYSYTGYIAVGSSRICIINDLDYETGMWLEDGVHRIQKITPSYVKLIRPDSAVEVILELELEE